MSRQSIPPSLMRTNEEEKARAKIEAEVKQKADEAARLEVERAKMQAEEEAKATAKAKAISDAAIDAMVAKKRAEIEEDQRAKPQVTKSEQATTALQDQVGKSQSSPPYRPELREIVRVVEERFDVSYGTACGWILKVADELRGSEAVPL